jgi:serine/threonine-protein kinase
VKILDFGIAQFGGSPARDDREMLAGTVSYMSPEQASAQLVDRRSDIWSLAIVIHEMLTGIRPFEGPNERAVRQAILEREPRLTTAFYADVPAGVDGVLRRALANRRMRDVDVVTWRGAIGPRPAPRASAHAASATPPGHPG